ncbi:MAG: PilZ domain-containing protein [Gammaproteobacteria bacterium]|nr:PilZ domain-containing protein [Gammaproteobacteria bacterium]
MKRAPARERRDDSRFAVELEASLAGLAAVTANVSLGGALVCCDGIDPDQLARGLGGASTRLDLWLPGGRHIGIDTTIVHVLSRGHECMVGVAFDGFDDDGLDVLRGFLRRRAGPGFA